MFEIILYSKLDYSFTFDYLISLVKYAILMTITILCLSSLNALTQSPVKHTFKLIK